MHFLLCPKVDAAARYILFAANRWHPNQPHFVPVSSFLWLRLFGGGSNQRKSFSSYLAVRRIDYSRLPLCSRLDSVCHRWENNHMLGGLCTLVAQISCTIRKRMKADCEAVAVEYLVAVPIMTSAVGGTRTLFLGQGPTRYIGAVQ